MLIFCHWEAIGETATLQIRSLVHESTGTSFVRPSIAGWRWPMFQVLTVSGPAPSFSPCALHPLQEESKAMGWA